MPEKKYDFDKVIPRENTAAIKYDLRKRLFGTDQVIPMWVADMDFETPDFIIDAFKKRLEHPIFGYSVRPESFYQAFIRWVERRFQWKINREFLLYTPGVVPALHMGILAFSNPGDGIIVQPPVYHPFFSLIRDNDRNIIFNPLKHDGSGNYRMDLYDLKKKIDKKTRLILLSHPHNPVGRCWTEEELKKLAEICLENRILIFSDEIHSDLIFKPHRHISMAFLGKETAEKTLTFMAPSKTFNLAGLATAITIISEEKLREKFNRELEKTHLWIGNIFGTVAFEAAYKHGDNWLEQLLDYLSGNIRYLKEFLSAELPGIAFNPPEATYLGWLNMKFLGMNDQELNEFMIRKAGLGFNDGPTFGPGGSGFQRINLACPRETLKKALDQLKQAVNSLK